MSLIKNLMVTEKWEGGGEEGGVGRGGCAWQQQQAGCPWAGQPNLGHLPHWQWQRPEKREGCTPTG